jgi:outer membrane protein OmpA-like peptidoglycan-associated protein
VPDERDDDLTGDATSPWPAFADLLAATTLLFVILFAAVAIPAILENSGRGVTESTLRTIDSTLARDTGLGIEVDRVGDYLRVRIPGQATFPANRSDLPALQPEGKAILRAMMTQLVARDSLLDKIDQIQVVGHTSSEGTAERNWRLSSERATSVAMFLIDSTGLSPCQVTALGRGRHYPVSPGVAKVSPALYGDPLDRRIELEIRPVVIGDTTQAARRRACVHTPGEVRWQAKEIVDAVEAGITARRWTSSQSTCEGALLYLIHDESQRLRKAMTRNRSRTVSRNGDYYFESSSGNPILRFAYTWHTEAGSAPSSERSYYDRHGTRVHGIDTVSQVALPLDGVGSAKLLRCIAGR